MAFSNLHYYLTILTAAFAAVSYCNPVPPSTCIDAGYDDETGGIVAQGGAVGTYKSLEYQSYNYASDTILLAGGVKYSSPHTAIFTSSQVQNGATPSISVLSPPYKTFDFKSFYFGCILPLENGAVAEATQCTVTVAGFVRGSNQEVAVASFTFTPPTASVAAIPMIKATLPASFGELYNATIVQGDPVTQVLLLDDLYYCLNK